MLAGPLEGCSTARLVHVTPDSAPLHGNDCLVVIPYSSDITFEYIEISGNRIEVDGRPGQHVVFVATSAGTHHFDAVWKTRWRYWRIGERREMTAFETRPDRLNYGGTLLIQKADTRGDRLYLRVADRSSMALLELEETHAGLLEDLPLAYTGTDASRFLEVYREKRAADGATTSHDEHSP